MIRRVAFLLLLCAGSTIVFPENAAPTDAAELDHVMQLDRATLLGFQASVHDAVKRGKTTQKQYECIRQFQPSVFTEIYVRGISQMLSPEEIRVAVAFYRSPTGSKSILQGFAELKHRIGTSVPLSEISAAFTAADDKAIEAAPELNETDNKAVQAFSETSAGKKLLLEHILQSAPITAQIKEKIVSLLPTCAPQK
jgi:hypothetical protein